MAKPLEISKKNLIFKSIWLVFALICLIIGIVYLVQSNGSGDGGGWFVAGLICCLPIIVDIFRIIRGAAFGGAVSGASHVTASIEGDTVYFRNHAGIGFVIGIIVGIIVSALIGLIFLSIRIIMCIIQIITIATHLR